MSPKADIAFDILLTQQPINDQNKPGKQLCIDVPRLSLASNLEQAKIDIKDKKAFANDIKEMLMSFIDEEDIDDD